MLGGGGGGGVIGGVGVVCGDAVDSGVGGVVCGVVCEFVCGFICVVVMTLISMMIVSVLEKDRWFCTRGRDGIVDGGGGDDIKHNTSNVRFEGYRYEMKGEKLYSGGGGGGGGGVIGGVGVVCGDAVDSRVGGVVCGVVCKFVYGFVCGVVCGGVCSGEVGVVKALISMMIVSVLEKDRWFGMRGRFVRWKGVRDGIVDGGGGDDIKHDTSNVRFKGYRYEMKGKKLLQRLNLSSHDKTHIRMVMEVQVLAD
nr:hypothetical protein [Tanacetum cinerariifolium]